MKRKISMFLGIVGCTMLLVGCSANENKKEEQVQNVVEETVELPEKETPSEAKKEEKEETVEQKKEETVEQKEEVSSAEHVSALGYSCKFDPNAFTLEATETADSFMYQTTETLENPVYVSVVAYKDMDAETLVDGMVLQNELEKSDVQDTVFGADGLKTKCISIEKEVNGMKCVYTYYVIAAEKGSLLVELGGYVGMPQEAEHKMEEITGTFSME